MGEGDGEGVGVGGGIEDEVMTGLRWWRPGINMLGRGRPSVTVTVTIVTAVSV
jgi:hypothetical protein